MYDYARAFELGLDYGGFLDRYATADQRARWDAFYESVALSGEQQTFLASWTREMKVLVLAGAWCGDCVNQCPIFERFAEACPRIEVRYRDRDDDPVLTAELHTCGGARVPAIVFLSEDGQFCGRAGDRTLAKYRSMVGSLGGVACPTGLNTDVSLTAQVVQDWLDEFERIQWMLRTSSRLRQLHGD
jgi:thiol-disulfide isomerase/thioredoxin